MLMWRGRGHAYNIIVHWNLFGHPHSICEHACQLGACGLLSLKGKMGISFRKGMEHYVTDRKNALSIMNWLSLENNICNKNYRLAFSEICSMLNIKIGI